MPGRASWFTTLPEPPTWEGLDTNTPLGRGLGFLPTADLVLPNPFLGAWKQVFSRGGSHSKRHVLFAPWPPSLAAPMDPRQRLLNQTTMARLRALPQIPSPPNSGRLPHDTRLSRTGPLQSRIRQPAYRQTVSRLMPSWPATWKRPMASSGPGQGVQDSTALVGDNRRPRALKFSSSA